MVLYKNLRVVFSVTANGDNCTEDSSCSDENASCYLGKCTCKSAFYDNNGQLSGGDCFHVERLKVSGLTFEPLNTTHATILWTPSTVASGHVNEYRVNWKTKDSLSASQTKTLPTNSVSAVISNLIPGKAYIIFVTSVNTETQMDTERSTYEYREFVASMFYLVTL